MAVFCGEFAVIVLISGEGDNLVKIAAIIARSKAKPA